MSLINKTGSSPESVRAVESERMHELAIDRRLDAESPAREAGAI